MDERKRGDCKQRSRWDQLNRYGIFAFVKYPIQFLLAVRLQFQKKLFHLNNLQHHYRWIIKLLISLPMMSDKFAISTGH